MTLVEYKLKQPSDKGIQGMYFRACKQLDILPPKNEFGNLIVTPEIIDLIEEQMAKKKEVEDFYTFIDPLPDCFKDLKDDDSDIGD